METTATIDTDRFDDPPPEGRDRHRMPWWPFVLAGFLIAIGIAIAVAWPIKVPYYTLSPGPVYDTTDFIAVADAQLDIDGEMFFLTVSLREANLFEYVAGRFSRKVDVAPRQNIRPEGVSPEDLRRENLARMNQSKADATFVALTKLGYEPTYIGTGALVIETVPDSAADGELQPNDVIVGIDGTEVAFRSDVIDGLAGKEIGDPVSLTIERTDVHSDEVETVDVELVLGPHVDDPSKPMIGILLDNNPPIIEFPVEVDIDNQNIGGPSAGMMFALEIMNQMTEEDLTGGRRIAGTGTIRQDGTVGPIGGITQKVHGAIDAGAAVVLIPAGNYDDAVAAAGDRVTVVRVETIDDALAYLEYEDPTAS
ncbi:MAG: PDZ domain-containing protein [Actinomycetota bacterium]